MKLKEFIEEYNVIGFQIIPNTLIINAVVEGDFVYGINVDTSNIPEGTEIVFMDEFEIDDDILTVDGLTLNINDTNMLGFDMYEPEELEEPDEYIGG